MFDALCGIYKITSPSNKIYIGQSVNINKRFSDYRYVTKSQSIIYNSIKKYGYDNHKFEIICELPKDIDQKVLDNYELLYWQQYKDCGFEMLNARKPCPLGKLSKEDYKKIAIKNSKNRTGIKQSKETIEKRRISQKERWRERIKPIYQYDLNENFIKEWDYQKDIENTLGIKRRNLYKCLNNQLGRKSAGGFVWSYFKK